MGAKLENGRMFWNRKQLGAGKGPIGAREGGGQVANRRRKGLLQDKTG